MTKGTVYSLHGGRIIGKTQNLSRTFLYAVRQEQKKGEAFAVVHGPIRHKEVRELISDIRAMGVPVLAAPTPMVKPDVVLMLEGYKWEIENLLKETEE